MPQSAPYQPLIFRLLHAIHGGLILGSAATGFWLYNTWDARWGRLPLPEADNTWMSIHHQIGEVLTALFILFFVYSIFAGRRRLITLTSLKQFSQLKPVVKWHTLHRLINTGLLGVVTLSMVSSRLMGGAKTLVNGEWNDVWYNLHILSWGLIVVLVIAHLLLSIKVGGFPFLTSAIAFRIQPKDSPTQWPKRFSNWVKRVINV